MNLKQSIRNLLNKLPHVRGLYKENLRWKHNSRVPPGHYYSPIVSLDQVKLKEDVIWKPDQTSTVNNIELNPEKQKVLLGNLECFYSALPFTSEAIKENRYFLKNTFYSYTDGIVLYAMIRHFKPKMIIEIGSGFSSALMMDVNDIFFNSEIALKFIEPYPTRLKSLMGFRENKNAVLIEENAQDIDLNIFKKLQKNDILFIDSSHIVKTGSDVNYILFEILPKLNEGVLIHFHDIFYPFEYPKKWVVNGRNWNESYFLKAFLMYNNNFEIILFSDYMHKFHKESFKKMPLTYENTGGNLWLVKK